MKPYKAFSDLEMSVLEYSVNYMESELLDILEKQQKSDPFYQISLQWSKTDLRGWCKWQLLSPALQLCPGFGKH